MHHLGWISYMISLRREDRRPLAEGAGGIERTGGTGRPLTSLTMALLTGCSRHSLLILNTDMPVMLRNG